MGFTKSLRQGTFGETFVTEFLNSLSFSVERNSDLTNLSKYDIICKAGKISFTGEIKYDLMSSKTNNVAIEIHNPKSDKPSGLYATEADIWFHLIPDGSNTTCWINSVINLKKYIDENKPKKIIELGGDNNSKLLLYAFEDILDIGLLRIENLNKTQAKKIIKECLINE